VIGGSLVVIVIGVGIWLRQVTWTNAKSKSVFDKFYTSYKEEDRRYFGNGKSRNDETVLPAVYDYKPMAGSDNTQKYAVNMTAMTGVSQVELQSLYNTTDGRYKEITDVGSFFNNLESKYNEVESDNYNYAGYRQRFAGRHISPVDACIGQRASQNAWNQVSEEQYNRYWQSCKSWLTQGYRFVMYSAAGVPQSRSGDRTFFEQQYAALKSDPNKKLTVQWMGDDGIFYYYQGVKSAGKTGRADQGVTTHNTAINETRDDVVWSTYHIRPSVAIIMWDKNGENSSNPAEPLWVLRLACANPIAAAVKEKKADVNVRVTGSPNPAYLPQNGSVTVKFKYELGKNVRGYAKHAMHYVFSSEPQRSIDPNSTAITYTSNPKASAVGKKLPNNKAVDILTDYPNLSLTYEEEVTITHANKNVVWQPIDGTHGRICRNLGVKPKPNEHSFPADLVQTLNKNSKYCIEIRYGGTTTPGSGGVFVDPLIPYIAPIGTPIGQDINGVNSWAIRPKQWKPEKIGMSASYDGCYRDGWYNPQGREKMEQDCQRKCQTRVGDKWVSKIIESQTLRRTSPKEEYGTWEPCGSSGDDVRYECKVDFSIPEWLSMSKYPTHYRGVWYKKEFRKVPNYVGMNEDFIECELDDVKFRKTSPPFARCTTGVYSGKCVYKHRTPRTEWQITKMIFKPENQLDSFLQKKAMTLDSSLTPHEHFCKNGTGDYRCETKQEWHDYNNFDEIDKLYPISKPKQNGQPPHGPYENMHINVTPIDGGRWSKVGIGTRGFRDIKYEIENLPSGTVVCFALSINPWKVTGDPKTEKWAHSKPECLTVSKKPYFAVENGMLVSGENIVTNLTKTPAPDSKRYGSWVEYNAAAQGQIMNALATNIPNSAGRTYGPDRWHKLTFANTSDPKGRFDGKIGEDVIDAMSFFESLPGNSGKYANTTYERHGGGNIGGHKSGIHIYEGNSTITGDINGGDQMVIVVKGDLTINHKVQNINAWLIVSGTLYTSDLPLTRDRMSRGDATRDERPLVVNGPVRASEIKLRRTAGSGIKSAIDSLKNPQVQFGQPAETFRLTPDTFIWSYNNSRDKGKAQTVYLREVAPRY
jgi:hypothetical protein cdiviTM7_02664